MTTNLETTATEKKETVKKEKKATAKKAVAKKGKKASAKKEVKHREESKSGKYKSIRHLMETAFAKNMEMTKAEAIEVVKKEFPNASFLVNPTSHFGWYKSHIVSKGEWKHVEKPKSKVKAVAKMKTAKPAAE